MFDDIKKSVGAILSEIGIKDKFDFTLVISGTELPVVSGRLKRSIDTCADGCKATIALTDQARDVIRPFGFEDVQVYLGGELVLTGVVYGLNLRITGKEKSATLDIGSLACDIVDSTKYPPYEFNFQTLADIADDILGEKGLTPRFESYDIESEFFERVCIDAQQSIFDFLSELARQRGVLISSNEKGEVYFLRADTSSNPVETIELATSLEGSFNGRNLFSSYRVTAMLPEVQARTKVLKRSGPRTTYRTIQTLKFAEAYDSLVPSTRETTTTVDNVTSEGLPKAAEWERSRRWAKACTITIPRIGWYPKDNDELYKENTLVTLKISDLWLEDGFDFLIKSVEYVLDSNGAVALITLIPPQAYTGEPIPDIFGGSVALNISLKSLGLPDGF